MNDAEKIDFVTRLLRLMDRYDQHDDLFWRTSENVHDKRFDEPASFFIICNDVFCWGSADLEKITPQNIDVLEQAMRDTKAIDPVIGTTYAGWLFCCRVRRMRPQGASYPDEPVFWPLFDACGPKRLVGLGNPHKHPADKLAEQAVKETPA